VKSVRVLYNEGNCAGQIVNPFFQPPVVNIICPIHPLIHSGSTTEKEKKGETQEFYEKFIHILKHHNTLPIHVNSFITNIKRATKARHHVGARCSVSLQ